MIKLADRYEQQFVLFDEDGGQDKDNDYSMVPMERKKGKPRGTYQLMQEYVGSDYPEFMRKITALGLTIKDHSLGEMKRGLAEYLKLCEIYNKPMTNQAMYTAMGLTYDIVYDITHGRSGNKEQAQLITYAKQLCAMHREALGISGAVNPLLILFWQKAFDGLNEMTEVNAITGGSAEDITREDAEIIAEKYAELPD